MAQRWQDMRFFGIVLFGVGLLGILTATISSIRNLSAFLMAAYVAICGILLPHSRIKLSWLQNLVAVILLVLGFLALMWFFERIGVMIGVAGSYITSGSLILIGAVLLIWSKVVR